MAAFVGGLVMSASVGGGGGGGGGGGRSGGEKRGQNVARGRQFFAVTGFPFPLGPLLSRRTLRTEMVPDVMWGFEQEQTLAGSTVSTNVRMTVVKMKSGKLWVHAPIAPTEECVALVHELNAPVAAIVNPTYAYEHRVFVAPFSRRFPDAQVFSVRAWSFPLPLPDVLLGINVHAYLDQEDRIDWRDEIPFKLLPSTPIGVAPYTEAAFFHRSSRSLICTDVLIQIPSRPPDIISRDKLDALGAPDSFLASTVRGDARASPDDVPRQSLGWMRMSLLAVFLGPSSLLDPRESFRSIEGRLTVSPVLRVLVFGKIRSALDNWISSILEWDFERIVPAHFEAPIPAAPADVQEALSCVLSREGDQVRNTDLKILNSINSLLRSLGAVKAEE